MPIAAPAQTSFIAGELSPLFLGRTDNPKYKQGVQLMQRFLALVQGSVTRCPGFVYTADSKSDGAVRIMPFVFNNGDAYVIEFGDEYCRFYTDRAQVMSGGVPYEIVSPYAAADVADIRFYDSGDVIYLAHPSYPPYQLATAGDTSWTFTELTFEDGPYLTLNTGTTLMALSTITNGASVTVNVSATAGINSGSGFVSTDVGRLIRWQNIDQTWWWLTITGYTSSTQVTATVGGVLPATAAIQVLGITNANPGVLTVPSPNPFVTGEVILLQGVGGMTQVNGDFFTAGTVSGTSIPLGVDTTSYGTYTSGGTVSLAGNKVTAITQANPCAITFGTIPSNFTVGLQVCITGVSGMTQINNKFCSIVAISGNTIYVNINSTSYSSWTSGGLVQPATNTWQMGEWSATTGYPSIVTSFEDRTVWAASPIAPTTLNMSNTGDYLNMAPTSTANVVAANNAIQVTLNGTTQDPIRWVHSDELGLLIGTKQGEWVCLSDVTGVAMSPVSLPSARESTEHGSASSVDPIRIGKYLLFLQNSRRKIREMVYAFQFNSFLAPDITVPSEHITETGIEDMCFQQEPFSLIWARRADGQLVALTYDKDQTTAAFHRHTIGGFSDVGQSLPPIVESLCSVPSPDGTQDDLWVSVQFYINGGQKRFIGYLSDLTTDLGDVANSVFLDMCIKGTQSPSQTITGLGIFNGQTVGAFTDGAPCPQQVVSGGQITVPWLATNYVVGLPYLSQLQTLRIDAGSATGTSQSKMKRIYQLFLDVYQTVGLSVGPTFDNLTPVDFRDENALMDAATPLYSGNKQCDYETDHDRDGVICIEVNQPTPCTIRAIMPRLNTQDAQ